MCSGLFLTGQVLSVQILTGNRGAYSTSGPLGINLEKRSGQGKGKEKKERKEGRQRGKKREGLRSAPKQIVATPMLETAFIKPLPTPH